MRMRDREGRLKVVYCTFRLVNVRFRKPVRPDESTGKFRTFFTSSKKILFHPLNNPLRTSRSYLLYQVLSSFLSERGKFVEGRLTTRCLGVYEFPGHQ